MSRRHKLLEAFEAFLTAHEDEDADDWTLEEVYSDLVVEVAADLTRQSPVVEVSYDHASLAVVAVYHFENGARTTFIDVLMYAQFTHSRERMHDRAQAAEAMVERLIMACSAALARAEPRAAVSYEPRATTLVLEFQDRHGRVVREVRHHVCGVPGHIVRTKDARIREAHEVLLERFGRARQEYTRGHADGEAGAREELERLRAELRQAHARIRELDDQITAAYVDDSDDDGGWTGG